MFKTDHKKKLIIAIDGPSASGKSSAAKYLAERLGYLYLDTGALYRAIAWKVIDEKADSQDASVVASVCRNLQIKLSIEREKTEVWLDEVNVTPFLRSPEVTSAASVISSFLVVRKKLLSIQREIGRDGGVIAEGRDIGTVVFPDADLKFYLDASLAVRGMRRYKDFLKQGIAVELSKTIADLSARDLKDSSRTIAPLKKGRDTIVIDSTSLSEDEVIEKMLVEVEQVLLTICH